MNNNTFIIAEVGVNHNGSIKLAKKLVDSAIYCGADAVKFQHFKANKLVTKKVSKANYQKSSKNISTQYKMLKKLELSDSKLLKLKKYCDYKKIKFLCSPFDQLSLKFLLKEIKLNTIKIGSGEITNAPLLLSCALSKNNIILSTGMSNNKEIKDALGVISYGLLNKKKITIKPSHKDFTKSFNSKKGFKLLKKKVCLLHCTTEYPAPLSELNLKSINTLKNKFKINIGYSDHSKGINASLISVLLGAQIIEKHFTLNKNFKGPDHKASSEPKEFKNLVSKIRFIDTLTKKEKIKKLKSFKNLSNILGNGIKKIMPSEEKNLNIVRRYLVANKDISIGEKFTSKNLTCKRSKEGISPMFYWKILGSVSKKKYYKDDII